MKILDSLVKYHKYLKEAEKFYNVSTINASVSQDSQPLYSKNAPNSSVNWIPHFHVFDQIWSFYPSKSRRCPSLSIFIEALTEQKKRLTIL